MATNIRQRSAAVEVAVGAVATTDIHMTTKGCLTRSSRRTAARDDVSATYYRRLSRGHTMTSYLLLAVVTCHVVNGKSL